MSPFWIAVLSFVSGTAVGVFIAINLRSGKDSAVLKEKLQALQDEFDEYKTSVGKHFVETSTLVNNLTQSYKDVHQHLSKGAQTLCAEDLALELQRTTVPLIRDAIEGDATPAVHPAEGREKVETSESEPAGAKERPAQPSAEVVSEPVTDTPPADYATAEPVSLAEEEKPGEYVAVEEPSSEATDEKRSDVKETIKPEAEPEPAPEPEETANLEEIMRHAQGASGKPRESDNLADIARHAEGAYLDDDVLKQAETIVSPDEIPDDAPDSIGDVEEKSTNH